MSRIRKKNITFPGDRLWGAVAAATGRRHVRALQNLIRIIREPSCGNSETEGKAARVAASERG